MGMAQVQKRATAKRDLVQHYVYLAETAGIETAERFLLQADASFADLAIHPGMGVALTVHRSELAGMHKWQVKRFENFLIF
jgi:toxin ParE1/3/4